MMFNSALRSLPKFIQSTNATWLDVYDYMENMCGDLKDYHWEEVRDIYHEYKLPSE